MKSYLNSSASGILENQLSVVIFQYALMTTFTSRFTTSRTLLEYWNGPFGWFPAYILRFRVYMVLASTNAKYVIPYLSSFDGI